jgi:hypothetical protein
MVVSHSRTKHNSCYQRWDMCPLCNLGSEIVSDEEQARVEQVIMDKYGFPDDYDQRAFAKQDKRKWYKFRPVHWLKHRLFMYDFHKAQRNYRRRTK